MIPSFYIVFTFPFFSCVVSIYQAVTLPKKEKVCVMIHFSHPPSISTFKFPLLFKVKLSKKISLLLRVLWLIINQKHSSIHSTKACQWQASHIMQTHYSAASGWQKTGVRRRRTLVSPPLSLSPSLSSSYLPTWPDMSSTLLPLQQHSAWPSHCLMPHIRCPFD